MADIIVNDESYKEIGTLFVDVGKLIEERLTEYINILNSVSESAVLQGKVHDNLILFTMKATRLQGQVDECTEEVRSLCTQYVNSIDEADGDLY